MNDKSDIPIFDGPLKCSGCRYWEKDGCYCPDDCKYCDNYNGDKD